MVFQQSAEVPSLERSSAPVAQDALGHGAVKAVDLSPEVADAVLPAVATVPPLSLPMHGNELPRVPLLLLSFLW